ncbi:putative ribonuclease H-like domain-containing protein [Tanacetum coccineum]
MEGMIIYMLDDVEYPFQKTTLKKMLDHKCEPVRSENQAYKNEGPKEANHSAGTQDNIDAENSEMEAESAQDYFILLIWSSYTSNVKSSEANNEGEKPNKSNEKPVDQEDQAFLEELERLKRAARASSTNTVNTASIPVSTAIPSGGLSYTDLTNFDQDDTQIPALEDSYDNPNDGIFTNASYDDEGAVADFINLETIVNICLMGRRQLGQKWIYRNKKDERGVVVRNKARIKAIRIFLAFASYMGFIVYQMDVKSSFLYGIIDEEVYVSQPPGFVDSKYAKKVYKVVKALYGLHQAPKAWYATLATFLLKSGYRRGTIDKTLFIKKDKNDIMLVQVYVDDIIFGSTKRSWCDKFEALMKSRFQISSMGEITFFLGLQVKHKEDVHQSETQKPLVKDEEATDVDVHLYRSMIGSLMYLTTSRPDIMFAVCACSRFQVTPKTSHLNVVKRIFRYFKV